MSTEVQQLGGDEYYEEEEYIEEVEEEEYYEEEEYVEEEEEDDDEPEAGGGMAAMIAAAATKREARRDAGEQQITHVEEEYAEEEDDDDEPEAGGGMAAMIAAAALKRKGRLDEGGEQKITHVEEAPDKGMDMAAVVALRAKQRSDRIDAGGEVKVREIPKAHKNMFVDVALEAARVGTLTRLNEHTVVATGSVKEETIWGGPGGLRMDHIRSRHFMAINEAAAIGQMRRLKAVEVTNYDTNVYEEEEEPEDIDKMVDDDGRRVVRTLHLLDRHVQEARKAKEENWAAENQTAVQYHSMEEVALPSRKAPGWKPKEHGNKTQRDLMDAISVGVAEVAWERNYRLGRPKALLRVTRKCECRFCVNPNPFQTHKYKQMHDEGLEEAEGPILEPENPKKTNKWAPPIRSTPPVQFQKPGKRPPPKLQPKPLYKVKRPPPKPIRDETSEPMAVEAPETPEEYDDDDEPGGPVILLDETTTWGRKREKTPKPKKDKKKKDKKKKKKKKGDDEGCAIM
jgi:hypothetical protein